MKQRESTERENLVIDWLDEIEIYKLEPKSTKTVLIYLFYFRLMGFWSLNPELSLKSL